MAKVNCSGLFKSICVLVIVICPSTVFSQRTVDDEVISNQMWIDAHLHVILNEKWKIYGDGGYRTVIKEDSWKSIYIRPSVRYHLNDLIDLSGGVGFFYRYNTEDYNQLETRPWQGFQLHWPSWTQISFNHLVRIEQRFYRVIDQNASVFEARMRYRLSGRFDFALNEDGSFWLIPFSAEMFVPLFEESTDLFRNRSRWVVGAGFHSPKSWRIVFEAIFQRSRLGTDDQFAVTDRAFRLKIYKYLNRNN